MSKIEEFFSGIKNAARETGDSEAIKEYCRVLGLAGREFMEALETGDKERAVQLLEPFKDSQPGTNEHAAFEALSKSIESL